jgi:hypothetical protein
MAKSKLTTGAGVTLFINGVNWGTVTKFAVSPSTPRKVIHGIDTPIAFELAPTVVEVSGQIGFLRTAKDTGLEGKKIAAGPHNLSKEQYFTVLLRDRKTGSIIFQADQCSSEGQSWDYESRALAQGSVNFRGIVWANDYVPGVTEWSD